MRKARSTDGSGYREETQTPMLGEAQVYCLLRGPLFVINHAS